MFTIVDSFACIQIYLKSTAPATVCPALKDTILNPIRECAKALNYEDIEVVEGFPCQLCSGKVNPCVPYDKMPTMASCQVCSAERCIIDCSKMWRVRCSNLIKKGKQSSIGSLARDFHIGFDPDYEFN